MDEKELQEFDLEDILREFGSASTEKPQEEPREEPREEPQEEPRKEPQEEQAQLPVPEQPALEQTRRMEPIGVGAETRRITTDTIRLDALHTKIPTSKPRETPKADNEEVRPWKPQDTLHSEPFTERWEPEYEQPIGEYAPPQPIVFKPKSQLQELKRKLVEGPEKRFYELTDKGVGKLQIAIFLSLVVVLVSAASTAMYAFGMVQENRMRLMVFGQFLALLVSALLGSFQLIEGIVDLKRRRFTLNTLLALTFVVCCLDGVLCLKQVRVPCCAAFSLEVTMSLWSTYQHRSTALAQMDTMRKATRLDGVAACPDYLDGSKGLLRTEGQVEDFMDHYTAPGRSEKQLNAYSLMAACAAFILGIVACVIKGQEGTLVGLSAGVQVMAVSLLAAVPATAFISHSRPTWILERRLRKLGTVLCGWRGVEGLSGKAVFPLSYSDLYSADAMRLNGMKFFGSREPDQVLAYATAVITAADCGLKDMFAHVLDNHNGRHYDVTDLYHYDNGGLGGQVEGQVVLLGSLAFLKSMDIEVPESARLNYGVYVVIDGELCGLFAVSYDKTRSTASGLSTLNAYRKLRCVLVSDDFMLTQGFLRSKFGIKPKRFLIPDYDVREQLRQKTLPEDAPVLLLTTSRGLAPLAYGVTGARVLRSTCRMGTALHIAGGLVGLVIMVLLVALGTLELLTPANMFLYQLVWMLPALLITEWTRLI